jgi:branched-chain amino acid transport system permease protein
VDAFENRPFAFAVGGFVMASPAGCSPSTSGSISPESLTRTPTLEHHLMLLFGGLGRVGGRCSGRASSPCCGTPGPVLGGRAERDGAQTVIFGVVITVGLAVEPKGVLAGLGRAKEYLRKRPYAY